jgi:hypothetical protein
MNGGTEHSCTCADGWMGSNCEQVGKSCFSIDEIIQVGILVLVCYKTNLSKCSYTFVVEQKIISF